MFTVDTAVDHAVSTSKQILALVPEAQVRSNLEALVDAQAAYTKSIYSTSVDLAKLAMENVSKFDASKFDWTKASKAK